MLRYLQRGNVNGGDKELHGEDAFVLSSLARQDEAPDDDDVDSGAVDGLDPGELGTL